MNSSLNFRKVDFRSPAVLTIIGVAATFLLALTIVIALLRTGGAKAVSDNAALIGALVALGGVFTTQLVNGALDDRRNQAAVLQNYFEQIGKLLADPKRPLQRSTLGDSLSTIARAQTLSVLEGLGPDRKRILLEFLHESGLIYARMPVVSLSAANLTKANLYEAQLTGAYLRQAFLKHAYLKHAYLNNADLSYADLSHADLSYAFLRDTDLTGANLSGANLRGVQEITSGEIERQTLDLFGAIMPDGSKHH
jgi:uncharacterized protein YjbI with pentapeptide repeats